MIGVLIRDETSRPIVREFFQLFKTPWEFHRAGAHYDVLLCCDRDVPQNEARLVLLYGTAQNQFEKSRALQAESAPGQSLLSFGGARLPIYRGCLRFPGAGGEIIVHESSKQPVAFRAVAATQTVVRFGYDLFAEIRHLLTCGQPEALAGVPTLDLHIRLLRESIVKERLPLVEIPPAPAGHPFTVCLTHDVDHVRLRFHRLDHTVIGFLYRATLRSFFQFLRGRRSLSHLLTNWKAAFSLPLIYLGLVKDPWDQLESYAELEKGLASTFFVIPRKDHPGVDPQGNIRSKRATRYAAADIAAELKQLHANGSEIALHGIDAWHDSSAGAEERNQIERVTGSPEMGVRMHWLYFAQESPRLLEQAGFSYDSTIGYNETIGYKAGTTQVYQHPGADRLLELSLHIMDTAMFYPPYLNLSDSEAQRAIQPMIRHAAGSGGVMTINWHDRSLGPERLWGGAYASLLSDLRAEDPWFATAGDAVAWFRKRRAASFGDVRPGSNEVTVQWPPEQSWANTPPLRLRVYNPAAPGADLSFEDRPILETEQVLVAA
ncbi:hypothetical protein BH20VER2_BH20VER2_06370 [soil metagenome]